MFMIINLAKPSILRKGDFYYCGGVSVWTNIKGNAMTFNQYDATRAKALMHNSDLITIEEA